MYEQPLVAPNISRKLRNEKAVLRRALDELQETQDTSRNDAHEAPAEALTRAIKAMPPGFIRALAQEEIERRHGALRKGAHLQPSWLKAAPEDHDATAALQHFEGVLEAIQYGDAEETAEAARAYAAFINQFSESRREQIEDAILQQYTL